MNWAAAQGIVAGYDTGAFGPEDAVTREQLAAMLYRYAGAPEPTGGLDGFADKDAAMAAPEVKEAVAEAEKFLEGNGRVLVRASGTEPLVRVLAEAPTKELCEEASAFTLKALDSFKVE